MKSCRRQSAFSSCRTNFRRIRLEALKAAAASRRVALTAVEYTKQPYDLEGAFKTGRKAGVDAYLWLNSPALAMRSATLSKLLVDHRLPAFTSTYMVSRQHPGTLVANNADIGKAGRRVAQIGVRILKGAKPGDIPVEQADEFELVVDLRTAKALGVKIPASVLARASRIIE